MSGVGMDKWNTTRFMRRETAEVTSGRLSSRHLQSGDWDFAQMLTLQRLYSHVQGAPVGPRRPLPAIKGRLVGDATLDGLFTRVGEVFHWARRAGAAGAGHLPCYSRGFLLSLLRAAGIDYSWWSGRAFAKPTRRGPHRWIDGILVFVAGCRGAFAAGWAGGNLLDRPAGTGVAPPHPSYGFEIDEMSSLNLVFKSLVQRIRESSWFDLRWPVRCRSGIDRTLPRLFQITMSAPPGRRRAGLHPQDRPADAARFRVIPRAEFLRNDGIDKSTAHLARALHGRRSDRQYGGSPDSMGHSPSLRSDRVTHIAACALRGAGPRHDNAPASLSLPGLVAAKRRRPFLRDTSPARGARH
jgi:hypothetical protein